jgi:hypothetical protein
MSNTMLMSRADHLAVKPKAAARGIRKKLDTIEASAAEIEMPFAEMDNSLRAAGDALRASIAEFRRAIDETIEYLNEVQP